jgi:hypothetical protein
MGKMGIFLIATKSFFLNLKMGILGTTKEMGLGESQNEYLVVLDNNQKKFGFRSSFTLAPPLLGAY